VIWSQILQLFHRNDHHIETTCRVQHLGCYHEGQGHSMTLHQNRVWPKTLLFEVRFYNYFWQTTSLCPIPIRGALPGSDRLLFYPLFLVALFFLTLKHGLFLKFMCSVRWLIVTIFWTWKYICTQLMISWSVSCNSGLWIMSLKVDHKFLSKVLSF